MNSSSWIILLLFQLINSSILTEAMCDRKKCTGLWSSERDGIDECYVPSGIAGCTCQDGYMAVVLDDDVKTPDYSRNFIHYTCCKSDNIDSIKASVYCSDYLPLENESDFNGCVIDKCEEPFPNSACIAFQGEKCSCASEYTAKLTGRSVPLYYISLLDSYVFSFEFVCCPSGGNDTVEVYAPPLCGAECSSAEVCFKEIGCYIPDNSNEFKGCVTNMCRSSGSITSIYECYTVPGESCLCADGLVAKPTGRIQANDRVLEYVCCPPGTPGTESGEECNPDSSFHMLTIILIFEGIVLFLVVCRIYRLRKNRKNKSSRIDAECDAVANANMIQNSQSFIIDESNEGISNQNLQSEIDDLVALKDKMQYLINQVENRIDIYSTRSKEGEYDDQNEDLVNPESLQEVDRKKNTDKQLNTKLTADIVEEVEDGKPFIVTNKICNLSESKDADYTEKRQHQNNSKSSNKIVLETDEENSTADASDVMNAAGDIEESKPHIPVDHIENEFIKSQEEEEKEIEKGCFFTSGLQDGDLEDNAFDHHHAKRLKPDGTIYQDEDSTRSGIVLEPNIEKSAANGTEVVNSDEEDVEEDKPGSAAAHVENRSMANVGEEAQNINKKCSFASGFVGKDKFDNREKDNSQKVGTEHHNNIYPENTVYAQHCKDMKGGVHEWIFYQLTKDPLPGNRFSSHSVKIILSPLLSWIVLMIQLLILFMIIMESAFPKCIVSGGCREGTYCDSEYGLCIDVVWNANNEMCPFLSDRSPLPFSSLFAAAFIYIYIIHEATKDLDQNARLEEAAEHRHKTNKAKHHFLVRWWIAFNIWGIYYIRGYLLPSLTFGALLAIFYSEEDGFMIAKVVLNGIAIVLIGEFDETLHDLLLTSRTQRIVEVAMAQAYEQASSRRGRNVLISVEIDRYRHHWWIHRTMCTCMSIISIIVLRNPIQLALALYNTASCNSLLFLSFPIFLVGVCFAALDGLIKTVKSWKFALVNFFLSQAFLILWYLFILFPVGLLAYTGRFYLSEETSAYWIEMVESYF